MHCNINTQHKPPRLLIQMNVKRNIQ